MHARHCDFFTLERRKTAYFRAKCRVCLPAVQEWCYDVNYQRFRFIKPKKETNIMLEFKFDTQLLLAGEQLNEDEIFDYITATFEGDSLLAVGDESLIKIHFHTNRPWEILAYCASLGEIFDIVVENMERQSAGLQG